MTELQIEPRRGRPRKDRSPGQEVIDWIEKNCFVPEGKLIGQKIKLQSWQQKCIHRIYDNDTRRAILSFGRKNGKTSLAACLLLAHLCGPRHVPNSQLFSAAQSREQAALIFALAAKMVRMHHDLRAFVHIKESAKELLCPELGTKYRALSAETTTAFGLSPSFIIHDELGQVRGPRSTLYEALETSTGAQGEPLSVIISTQAPTDNDLLSILIDDAMAGHDPRTVCELFTAPPEDDPFDEKTIALANPALGTFLSLKEVLGMARDAKRMPAREAEYRNLILNQRVDANAVFVSPAVWKANGDVPLPFDRTPVFGGLDLSEVADLTALVLMTKTGDSWSVLPTFWLPGDNLREKSIADRVPYDVWAKAGFLETTPGRTISYEYVAAQLRKLFDRYNIQKLAFDRWNMKHLVPWLNKVGFSESFIKERFVEFGQGVASMSPALRDLEQLLLDARIRHGDHPVLTMCAANATVVIDDAGNRKLSKRKSVGRIDGLVALTMAVGVCPLNLKPYDVTSMIM